MKPHKPFKKNSLSLYRYKVYDMYPSSIEEVDFLHELMLTDDNLDFWEEPNRMGGKVTVMVAPEHQSTFVGAVQAENLIMSIRHEDLGEHVQQFWEDYDTRRSQRAPGILIDFDDFNTLEEIEEWMYSLESSECAAQGLFCEVRNIGSTYEGRDILSLRRLKKPDAAVVITEDSNSSTLSTSLPLYTQYINISTRGEIFMDKMYCNVRNAYTAKGMPPIQRSDYIMVHLLPTYIQHLTNECLQVNDADLQRVFFALNSYKAKGPDNISPRILKLCVCELSPIFSHIFNK
ncbi:hypothetical protein CAPTEDRAFT_207317 [Capitella teleta]|uniref:Carboxypeptidase activation peptide domain-containing protein n=1 Tax=Capitella teleta TaxID=283909 RepID=R7UP81_CAPTE|nr:hypothetical protein CAPTEDRAFT_207317 [Capitella teleta]|eukprot:ELU08000.1 hypothetical protein CAPTEDRAFT_207317 [Capitella teleta]